MKTTYFTSILFGLLAAILGALPMTSHASDNSLHKLVDGVNIHLGILPAKLIQKGDKQQPESKMHGGVPVVGHRYHVTVALFDAATGNRITDAQVKASVSSFGLYGTEKKLERMAISDAISYGNYFRMPGTGIYRIRVNIRRPGIAQATKAEFEYTHGRL